MLGPGVMTTDAVAERLILAELAHASQRHTGLPRPDEPNRFGAHALSKGAKETCERHVSQCRAHLPPINGASCRRSCPETDDPYDSIALIFSPENIPLITLSSPQPDLDVLGL